MNRSRAARAQSGYDAAAAIVGSGADTRAADSAIVKPSKIVTDGKMPSGIALARQFISSGFPW